MSIYVAEATTAVRAQLALLAQGRQAIYSSSSSYLTVLFTSLLAAYLLARYLRSSWRHLPPGPTGYPLIGSVLSLFDKKRFFAACESYGDVVSVNIAGQLVVILNTQRAAADLLDRRAVNFSGRPRSIFFHELLCGGLIISTEGQTDRWKRMRRAVHEAFRPSAAGNYYAIEGEEAARLALALANNKEAATAGSFSPLFVHFAASIILAITYDRPVRNAEDAELVKTVKRMTLFLTKAAAPGSHLVDLFPWMLAIPDRFAKWKRDAFAWHERASQFWSGLIEEVKTRMAEGQARPCLVRTLVEEEGRFGLSDAETMWAAGLMYLAGSETQAMTLEWFTLIMISHPDIQRRAQAELDAVIGRGRAPRVGDRDQLPYLSALVREALRWKSSAPIGLPHVSEEDDWYKGFFIPKGTICIANVYACHLDPEVYGEDAAYFNPARHLDENGQLKPAPADTKEEGHISYGFGRRICVARHVANDALFAAAAMMLWAFNLQAEGEVDIDGYIDKGLTICPKPFVCNFKPRFPEAMTILKEEINSH
ncbi:cytochrome P450 [Vararia minispora EC-137]|uniref:Cytochrome P450 n=1 Tax=Vararia minispora EC-137 TaxID=1314806 RepID=A0ACB8QB90_9AGAM|nr:cytochrome P450 [Vararia minispora EC-137]